MSTAPNDPTLLDWVKLLAIPVVSLAIAFACGWMTSSMWHRAETRADASRVDPLRISDAEDVLFVRTGGFSAYIRTGRVHHIDVNATDFDASSMDMRRKTSRIYFDQIRANQEATP